MSVGCAHHANGTKIERRAVAIFHFIISETVKRFASGKTIIIPTHRVQHFYRHSGGHCVPGGTVFREALCVARGTLIMIEITVLCCVVFLYCSFVVVRPYCCPYSYFDQDCFFAFFYPTPHCARRDFSRHDQQTRCIYLASITSNTRHSMAHLGWNMARSHGGGIIADGRSLEADQHRVL